MDFYKPMAARAGRVHPDDHYLKLARWATVAWGAILFAIGFGSRHIGSALESALTVASILYGGLLGVFLLGLLTRFVRENAAIAGMAAGLIVMVCVRVFTHIQFTWYVLIGTTATFAVGCLASMVLPEAPKEENEPSTA
jgi:Na+/proline symporter